MNTARIYNLFCEYIEKKYDSVHTQRAYESDVKHFLNSVNNFDEDSLNAYVFQLHKENITNRTIRRKLSSVSIFFNFLKDSGLLDKNPVDFLEKPKISKNLPSFLDVDDIINLLGQIDNARDRALLELAYSSSLRASETVSLNVEDVDFKHLRMRIKRKGGKTAYIPITPRAAEFVESYVGNRKSGALFLNRYNKRISTRSFQKIVKKYALSSIFKDISPHTLRHSKATHLLNSGMDIRILQKFLGHSSIRATQIYTHLNIEELSKTYDASHPLAKNDEE